MQKVYISGKDYETAGEVHEFLAEQLDFPEYYGKNLSALYDVLTDLSEDTSILLDFSGMQDDSMLEMLERMAEVMTDAADMNSCLEVTVIS